MFGNVPDGAGREVFHGGGEILHAKAKLSSGSGISRSLPASPEGDKTGQRTVCHSFLEFSHSQSLLLEGKPHGLRNRGLRARLGHLQAVSHRPVVLLVFAGGGKRTRQRIPSALAPSESVKMRAGGGRRVQELTPVWGYGGQSGAETFAEGIHAGRQRLVLHVPPGDEARAPPVVAVVVPRLSVVIDEKQHSLRRRRRRRISRSQAQHQVASLRGSPAQHLLSGSGVYRGGCSDSLPRLPPFFEAGRQKESPAAGHQVLNHRSLFGLESVDDPALSDQLV